MTCEQCAALRAELEEVRNALVAEQEMHSHTVEAWDVREEEMRAALAAQTKRVELLERLAEAAEAFCSGPYDVQGNSSLIALHEALAALDREGT